MRYLSTLFVAFAVVLSASATAQEHKRVEVTKNYTHEVAPKQKMVAPTDISDAPIIEPEINYNVNPETWQIELEDHNFNPARASYWDYNRARRFFLQLGAGYPATTDVTLRYTTHNVRVGYFGVGIDHDGNFAPKLSGAGLKRTMAESYAMSNGVNIGGGVVTGRQMFEVSADYDYTIRNRYATVADVDRLNFHDANLGLRYGDDFVDLSRLNFAVSADGGYWSHAVPPITDEVGAVAEIRAGIAGDVARDFQDNVVGIRAGFDFWRGAGICGYQDLSFNIAARYARDFGMVDVAAELKYKFDKVSGRANASHFFMPAAKITIDLGKVGIVPFVELATNVKHNGIEALYDANPFIAYYPMEHNFATIAPTRSYDLHFGISGADRGSKLAYRVYLGGNFMRDQMLWYVNEVGMFGFAQENNNRLFVGAEVEYHPVGGLTLSASARAHADNIDAKYVVSDPKVVANILAEYKLKRWKFSLTGDFAGKRRWSGYSYDAISAPIAFTAPATFDLNAKVNFRASKSAEIYIQGCNLLNQQIYDLAHYYRNGVGFMAGVKVDF